MEVLAGQVDNINRNFRFNYAAPTRNEIKKNANKELNNGKAYNGRRVLSFRLQNMPSTGTHKKQHRS